MEYAKNVYNFYLISGDIDWSMIKKVKYTFISTNIFIQ